MVEPLRFPDNDLFKGWGEPLRCETTIEGLEVIQGAIPEGLEGTLYRVGADWQYPSRRDDDIFIDGEGMIHSFRFENGQASYRSPLGAYRPLQAADAGEAAGLRAATATNIPTKPRRPAPIWARPTPPRCSHAGRLYALKESDLPYEIDPDTLETIGATDMSGQIGSISFTAHPKVDPINNELLGFAYQAKGDATRDIVYYLFGGDGRKKHEIWFEMPYAACVHDFAITDEWVVFPFFPLITDLDVIKGGGPFYQWDRAQETVIALVPRYGTDASEIRWFRGPATSAGI